MSAFMTTRLPSPSKSLEAIEFMQNNHFAFRISATSGFLETLMSPDGVEASSPCEFQWPSDSMPEAKPLSRPVAVADLLDRSYYGYADTFGSIDAVLQKNQRPSEDYFDDKSFIDSLAKANEKCHIYYSMDGKETGEVKEEELVEEEEYVEKSGIGDYYEDSNNEEKKFVFGGPVEIRKRGRPFVSGAGTVGRHLYTCPVRRCRFSSETSSKLAEHAKSHNNNEKFHCDVCKTSFHSMDVAMEHIYARKEKKCCKCAKTFAYETLLRYHIRHHSGEKPHVCGLCKKAFCVKGNLKIHERTHTNEKLYECGYCQRRFAQKGTLVTHIRLHTGEKPFSCEECDKSFAQKALLNNHKKKWHRYGQKP